MCRPALLPSSPRAPGEAHGPPPRRPHPCPVADADLTFDQTGWGDSGVYYCSVVSAQDLQGNNEAYAELIVLGEWARAPRARGGDGNRDRGPFFSYSPVSAVCPPPALQLALWTLSPASLSPPGTTSHWGFSLPCTPGRDPSPQ